MIVSGRDGEMDEGLVKRLKAGMAMSRIGISGFGAAGVMAASLLAGPTLAQTAPPVPAAGSPSAAPAPSPTAAPVGPATAPAVTPAYDPFEPANRFSYKFSRGLDRAIIRPVAMGYAFILPSPVRDGVRNMIDNINTPNTVLNDVLQVRPARSLTAAGRFIVNSTIGIGGIFDVASPMGLAKRDADFGQTLGRWGVPAGPYIFVPVLGPTDLRDGVGRIADSFAGLLNIHDLHVGPWERFGIGVVDGIDLRVRFDSTIEDLNRTATDPYVTARSVYLQNRQSMITDTATAINQLPSFDAPPSAARATAP